MGSISWSGRGRIDMGTINVGMTSVGMTNVGMTRGAWCGSSVVKEESLVTYHVAQCS